MWEAMNMLLRDCADYLNEPKVACMADLRPMTEMDKNFPSPRFINSHYRHDVLPKEFRGRKTVLGMYYP